MRVLLLALAALLLPTPALAQEAVPTGKLPAGAAPIAYRLDLTIVPDQERFSGHTEIDIELKKPAAALYMHGRDLHVTSAVVRIGTTETPVTFKQINPLGLAQVDFGRTVAAGKMTLKFDYDAPFENGSPSGLYRVQVAGEWYSWTQFQSIDARAAFPSFDEPGFKTPFTVSIATKPGFVAATNGAELSHAAEGALVRHRFAPTLPLPTYLIAFVTGPFVTAETMVPPSPQRPTPLPLRIIATKPNAGKLQFALDQSGPIVALLEAYFNQAFPYPKLDQVASPVMPGAMENAGIDIYGDGILLLDPHATTEDKQTFGMVVAHELSHQWFGDLATPAWWDDIWLNESFANWMGYRIGNEWRPDLNIGTGAIDEAFTAMGIDALATGRPIHERIDNDGAINAAFDQITYGKGGQVVAMIAAYMGDEKFRDGVRLHMRRHMYGNATTDEFFASLADAAKDPRVLASLRSFVDQQGVPVVTLHREGGKLVGSQARYAYFGSNVEPKKWVIPFCVRREAKRTCTLIDKPSATIAAPGSGVLVPNAGGWGYYRFDLDAADWDALIAAAPGLPAGEALAVNDSLWASFYAGRVNVPRLVAAARAMSSNKDSNVAVDGGQRLAGLIRRGLVSPEAMPAFRKLIDGLYAPLLGKLGFDPALGAHASDDPDRQKLRAAVVGLLADEGRNASVREKLIAAADRYLAGDEKALDPAYRAMALATAVQERGIPFAKAQVERALANGNDTLRGAVFEAIANAGSPEIGSWFLNDLKDERITPGQRVPVVFALLRDGSTNAMAADYLLANFGSFARGGGGIFAARSAGAFNTLCTVAQADSVDAKLRPALVSAATSTLALDRALETIRNCARFKDAKAGEVSAGIVAAH
ncbi:MAG: M1 family metallopeptidase [Pseudomonadota bacterium]